MSTELEQKAIKLYHEEHNKVEHLEMALDKAKDKLSENQLKGVMEKLAWAQENFKIVRFGKGAHNKNYALLLLDESIEKFKEFQKELDKIQK